jgi:hypothetical protein
MMDAYLRNITVEAIGPSEARAYLNTGNIDHVDYGLVNKYSYDMQYGHWAYPGGVIEITADGHLKDGHHRLLAIIMSQVVLPMIVVRNVTNNGRH